MARLHQPSQRLVEHTYVHYRIKHSRLGFLPEPLFYLFLDTFCECAEVCGGSAAPPCAARTSKRCCNPQNKYIRKMDGFFHHNLSKRREYFCELKKNNNLRFLEAIQEAEKKINSERRSGRDCRRAGRRKTAQESQ